MQPRNYTNSSAPLVQHSLFSPFLWASSKGGGRRKGRREEGEERRGEREGGEKEMLLVVSNLMGTL